MLLLLNVIVSCVVICFSYGLYQNYNVILQEGKQDDYKQLSVICDKQFQSETEYGFHKSGITVGMLKEFLLSLSPETQENLVCAGCTIMLENNLYCFEGADTGLCGFDFEIRTVDGELALSEKWSSVLTEEEFREGKKVAALSRKRFDENETTAEVLYLTDGNIITSYTRTLSDGEKYITINGEKYEIRILDSSLDKPRNYTYKDDEIDITDRAFIPLTSLPDDLELNMLLEDTPILLNLNKAVTRSQYNDIQSCLADATQNRAALPPVEFTEVGEIYYYRTVLLISVVIAVLTAINMAILYRYILQRRSSDLAVMRICGCSKVRATPFNRLNFASLEYIYSQMNTLFPIALCIFILTVISSVSISAIHTKRQLHNYAIFYICGAKWRSCALLSLKASLMTCGASTVIMAVFLIVGRLTFMKETIITFGVTAFLVCLGVTILYLALSMIMPLVIIRSTQPREILKEE